jgi:hypothetical protein
MRRFLHRLFRRHKFEPFQLIDEDGVIYYFGHWCACGEYGYLVPK